ncbi:AEC family transporter [Lachnoclostridium sp. Marseille-P6806]|uniref:AEC family transporter n=1 Tax=Lachnoclostridium sp. Marseille-P6806 TaxID=2364793 RepID=UPI0010306819|nr:AEC family transporter [Lachnoclostridium sp. Marseille-P6806]
MNLYDLVLTMFIIFLLIACGYILRRKNILDDRGAKLLSFLVVNITNPAMLLDAAISNEQAIAPDIFLRALLLAVISYAILIAASYLICPLLRIPRRSRYSYQMLTVYGNTAFIGFPVCVAVLGPESLVYVVINGLIFSILIYTYGAALLRRAKRSQEITETASGAPGPAFPSGERGGETGLRGLLRLLNIGTLSAAATIVIYLFNPPVTRVIADALSYMGRATVFLSMLVLGCSAASMPLRALFLEKPRMYLFLAIRMLLLPFVMVLAMKPFVSDPLLLGTMAVLLALPGANMPLMMARELDLDSADLSRGIILSTLLCIFTIPLVCLAL